MFPFKSGGCRFLCHQFSFKTFYKEVLIKSAEPVIVGGGGAALVNTSEQIKMDQSSVSRGYFCFHPGFLISNTPNLSRALKAALNRHLCF